MLARVIHQAAPGAGVLTPQAIRGLRSAAFRWSVAPAAIAWILLLSLPRSEQWGTLCVAPRAGLADGFIAQTSVAIAAIEPTRMTAEWGLMIVAMMFPLLSPAISHISARSFKARRNRSVGIFIAGYLAPWLGAAITGSMILILMRSMFAFLSLESVAGVTGCGLAALWQLSSAKKKAVNRCHGTKPLHAFGTAADLDALSFGLVHGSRCVASCFPLTVLPFIAGGGLGMMAALFAVLLAERARHIPQYGVSAIVLVFLGLTLARG